MALTLEIVVHNVHADNGGGGYYSLPLIEALKRFGKVRSRDEHEQRNLLQPDLFVCIDHTGMVFPIGRKNLRVCYCPLSTITVNTDRYDGAICLGDWIAQEQALKWKLPYWVIYPAINLDLFRPLPKRNLILNAGTFFYDKGHSKNQLAVLKWFKDEGMSDKGWEIVFIGGVHNSAMWYYNAVVELAKDTRGAAVLGHLPHGPELYRLFGEARFLIHANGATGNYPDEVEHFGIVAIEALASGCQPIVHDSGGCARIPGMRVWRHWGDIERLMNISVNRDELICNSALYSFGNMVERVEQMLKDLGLV